MTHLEMVQEEINRYCRTWDNEKKGRLRFRFESSEIIRRIVRARQNNDRVTEAVERIKMEKYIKWHEDCFLKDE